MEDEPAWARRMNLRRVLRPLESGGHVDLAYLRSGPEADLPVVVLPGGPGLASALPYWGFRRKAHARDLDVIMMEHRGIGLSRLDYEGADLPQEAVTVVNAADDLAAVLDDCGVREAVIYGTSYGSYLAQAFGVRHPERVAGMVLDSTMLGASNQETAKENLRRLFWDGGVPETAKVTSLLRELVESGAVPVEETGRVVRTTYEFGGLDVLRRMLEAARHGRRRTWKWVASLGDQELTKVTRHVMEGDLVEGISYGELGYGRASDGGPLDPHVRFAQLAVDAPDFAGESFDLPNAIRKFDWPTAVVSGGRDLRTPRCVAEQVVDAIPDAVLTPFPDLGHSTLDSHPLAALHVAHSVAAGTHRTLPERAPRVAALPRRGSHGWIGTVIDARLRAERLSQCGR